MSPSNSELLRKALAGDASAWTVLIDRHLGLMWSIIRRYPVHESTHADILQVVALRLIDRGHQIREPDRIASWIASVTHNECRALLQGREIPSESVEDASPEDPVDEERLVDAETTVALNMAFSDLPKNCQALLRRLFASDRPDYRTIADELGIPVGSIGPTRRRCLDRLAKHQEILRIRNEGSGSV